MCRTAVQTRVSSPPLAVRIAAKTQPPPPSPPPPTARSQSNTGFLHQTKHIGASRGGTLFMLTYMFLQASFGLLAQQAYPFVYLTAAVPEMSFGSTQRIRLLHPSRYAVDGLHTTGAMRDDSATTHAFRQQPVYPVILAHLTGQRWTFGHTFPTCHLHVMASHLHKTTGYIVLQFCPWLMNHSKMCSYVAFILPSSVTEAAVIPFNVMTYMDTGLLMVMAYNVVHIPSSRYCSCYHNIPPLIIPSDSTHMIPAFKALLSMYADYHLK